MRENATDKASRLLVEARVCVLWRDHHRLDVVVRGDSGLEHHVNHDAERGWRCDCEAARFHRVCAHIKAAQRVVVLNRTEAL